MHALLIQGKEYYSQMLSLFDEVLRLAVPGELCPTAEVSSLAIAMRAMLINS
jgi:hypothetical protein